MSRRKKRRGRGQQADARVDTPESQGDGIEIVDDVGVLDGVAAAPTEATSAPAPVEPSASGAIDGNAPAAGTEADASASTDVGPTTASPVVHVVEPLHESPPPPGTGERTVETLGELLQHAREAKGLSLEEVSARTRIALPTLRHLENDRFGELPAEAYVKGFLRSYGGFLSLDVAMLLRRYEKLSGHIVTPVAEIWDEVDVNPSRVHLWKPSRRTVALSSAVIVVAALAWVFWSQGAVMLGLRPEGELQQIEMQLQRESRQDGAPQAPITGLDDAALQQESVPAATPTQVSQEDTAPTVPLPPVKSAPTPQGAAAADAKPASTAPEQGAATKPAADAAASGDKPAAGAQDTKPVAKPPAAKPAPKPVEKPKKKAPAPSPEDAAGPPA